MFEALPNPYLVSYSGDFGVDAASRPWVPWYSIPADDKPYMRFAVAEIIVRSLEQLRPAYPSLSATQSSELDSMRQRLLEE